MVYKNVGPGSVISGSVEILNLSDTIHKKVVDFVINVPKNVTPKEYLGSILAKTINDNSVENGGSGENIVVRMGLRLYLTVAQNGNVLLQSSSVPSMNVADDRTVVGPIKKPNVTLSSKPVHHKVAELEKVNNYRSEVSFNYKTLATTTEDFLTVREPRDSYGIATVFNFAANYKINGSLSNLLLLLGILTALLLFLVLVLI
ncbi:MAG: hypothetical protein HY225_02190 [Candidatus Vogelbacteria bacterium]|nr:hypothetical protein [Candidatus Vogelbacteria bacterium]